MPRPYFIGHVINLLTAFLFIYGGQAHLTDRYTPDLARGVGRMLGGVRWFGFGEEQVSHLSLSPSCGPVRLSFARGSRGGFKRAGEGMESRSEIRKRQTDAQLRMIFGLSAITVALLLIIPRTSRIAMRLAVGFTCLGAYSAWYRGGPMGPHWTILGVQVVGLLTN